MIIGEKILEIVEFHGHETACGLVCEWLDVDEAGIDPDGEIWVTAKGESHYLDNGSMAKFVGWAADHGWQPLPAPPEHD